MEEEGLEKKALVDRNASGEKFKILGEKQEPMAEGDVLAPAEDPLRVAGPYTLTEGNGTGEEDELDARRRTLSCCYFWFCRGVSLYSSRIGRTVRIMLLWLNVISLLSLSLIFTLYMRSYSELEVYLSMAGSSLFPCSGRLVL